MGASYVHGMGSPYRPHRYQSQSQLYNQTPPSSTDNLSYNPNAISSLAQAFGAANLSDTVPLGVGKAATNAMATNNYNINPMFGMQSNGQSYYYPYADTSMMMSGLANAQAPYGSTYNMGYSQPSFVGSQAYSGYEGSMAQAYPMNQRYGNWATYQQVPTEIPDLTAPRRNSISSNEDSGPKTPFHLGNYAGGTYTTPHQPSEDVSPWKEPTPVLLARNFPFKQIWRNSVGDYEPVDYWTKTREAPVIPVAIPAKQTKDSGRGTFDKILDNEHGTTNVYIRGLWPDTTDELLYGYGIRFGDIKSCKAILDLNTGTCKGFGFIMYHNYFDAENCIRCFYYLGYEAKFAKLSHNERLKNCADLENNNLYVSNLPKAMTETELKALFTGVFPMFKVTSTKVLKDNQGISRGVGFVRFETHDICEQVLDHFGKNPIQTGEDETTLQLRYADSEAQKQLKRDSAAHRAFKADEYNREAFGPNSPFYGASFTPVYPSPIQTIAAKSSGSWRRQNEVSPVSSLVSSHALFGGTLQPTAVPALKAQLPSVPPTYELPPGDTVAESPCATAAGKRINNEAESFSGNTSERSSTDAYVKDNNSESGDVAKPLIKVENFPVEGSVEDAGTNGPSPSKAGKAKL